jgi:hypothetical protein
MLSNVSMAQGVLSIVMMVVGRWVFRQLGWVRCIVSPPDPASPYTSSIQTHPVTRLSALLSPPWRVDMLEFSPSNALNSAFSGEWDGDVARGCLSHSVVLSLFL